VKKIKNRWAKKKFLSKIDPVEHTFFTKLKIIDNAGTWTPGYLKQNLLLHYQ
jgi:hypothetical protein